MGYPAEARIAATILFLANPCIDPGYIHQRSIGICRHANSAGRRLAITPLLNKSGLSLLVEVPEEEDVHGLWEYSRWSFSPPLRVLCPAAVLLPISTNLSIDRPEMSTDGFVRRRIADWNI